MKRIPSEFEELLSAEGRKVLAGRHRLCGSLSSGKTRFVSAEGLISTSAAKGVGALLEKTLTPLLIPMEQAIPRSATWGMKRAYHEKLPKTVKVKTAMLDDDASAALPMAQEIGLIAMLSSKSIHRFAESLSGYPLRHAWGLQALRYGPSDYSGPHNDHHPDEPLGRNGYTDLHFTFSNSGVEHQWLVYEREGHLTEIRSIASAGGVTCYRLPFWHYTTPMVGTPNAARWVLLSTFIDRFTT